MGDLKQLVDLDRRDLQKVEIKCNRSLQRCVIEFMLIFRKDGEIYYGQPVVLEKPEVDGMLVDTTFQLEEIQAQLLMDELYNAGIRPSEGNTTWGVSEAKDKHIEDLRTIAFKTLKIDKSNKKE